MRQSLKKATQPQAKPITIITSLKSTDDLRVYLEQRSSLNLSLMKDDANATVLHSACYKNDFTKLKIYVQHFEAYVKEHHGRSQSQSTFQMQLKSWINTSNNQGYVPLHFAALHGNIQIIEFLLRFGANIDYQTPDKQNVAFMMVQNNHLKPLIKLLQMHTFNLNDRNLSGDTIMHKAAYCGYTQIASYLLTLDIDPNSQNNLGETPLMLATKGKAKRIVKVMLLKGLNRHVKNNQGQQALDYAVSNNDEEIAKILDDRYTVCDQIKIASNFKLVYRDEKPSWKGVINFFIFFNLLYVPINILAQFIVLADIPSLSFILQGVYYALVLTIYLWLLRKQPKSSQKDLTNIELPICAQCKTQSKLLNFHCFICKRCIQRYDHHCPWINNCVGSYNICTFIIFLMLLLLGCIYIVFSHCCLLFGLFNDTFVTIRDLGLDNKFILAINIVTLIFGVAFTFFVSKLLLQQLRNLFTNSTSYERSVKKNIKQMKAQSLLSQNDLNTNLSSTSNLTSSSIAQADDDQNQVHCNCFSNCCLMLTYQSPSR